MVSTITDEAGDQILLIDTDVHETLTSSDQLLPYLGRHWHRYITEGPSFGHAAIPRGGFAYGAVPSNRLDWPDSHGQAGTTVEALRTHMLDSGEADVVILSGSYHVSTIHTQPEFVQALARAYNDWQIEHWIERDPRIAGSVHVVAGNPAEAVAEIRRVAQHPRVVQVFLPTVTDRQYGDVNYYPIYEAAVENDLLVAFHHGPHTQTAIGYPRYFAEWHALASPQAAMAQLASLVFSGVFERFPTLKFAFLEASIGWVPWAMRRFDENAREMRHEIPWIKRLPSEYIRDSVRFSTQPMADTPPHVFKQIVAQCESNQLFMFSSDYPHYDGDPASAAFPPGLPADLRRRVFSWNALDAYPRLGAMMA